MAANAVRGIKERRSPYVGYVGAVEMQAAGVTREGQAIMRVGQVSSRNERGERQGWQLPRWAIGALDESCA